jgi:NADH-quinone oxidoreductase subunit L
MVAAVVFLPLLGAFIAGFFGRAIGDRASQVVTCGCLILAAVLGLFVFADVAIGHNARTVELLAWMNVGTLDVSWALRLDTLSAVMIMVVTVVSSCVHVYSVGYMHEDPAKPRFMAYLSLFTFFMLMLVTADNLVQMFFGWEGVGLASYLLIGFWYDRPSANAAAIKAFVVNRVGDFGYALGIFGCFLLFDAVSFDAIFQAASSKADAELEFLGIQWHALTVICLLLFIGAMGKSAQLGLHTWLPDAMEGPTPVSALIHAATMVTAGVFMVCRMSPLFEYAPDALTVVTLVGAATAFFAATVGLTQFDIKRVIAYSTCSQLGYMFFAAGVSAYGAAMFHLFTHAFFKALLFLGAGSVIHAMHHEQDMRRMGGIWRKIPVTYALMWIGSLALAGVPLFAGYYSKDIVLEAAFARDSLAGDIAFWAGIAAATMTAFYSWRLLFMTFHGKTRADHHTFDHAHESPPTMLLPLFVLAAGAVFSGMIGYEWFVGHHKDAFWAAAIKVLPGNDTVEAAHHVPTWVKILPIAVGAIGIAAAWVVYIGLPGVAGLIVAIAGPVHRFFYKKWYFDELYDFLFVKPSLWLGRGLWKTGDGTLIDRLGPDGVAATAATASRRLVLLQTGYVYHYAFAMLIGIVVLLSLYLLGAR